MKSLINDFIGFLIERKLDKATDEGVERVSLDTTLDHVFMRIKRLEKDMEILHKENAELKKRIYLP